jgi:hypothetical protein
MKISIRIDSAAAQAQLRRWGGELRAKVQEGRVAGSCQLRPSRLKQDVRSSRRRQITVVKKSFLKGFTAKVLAKDPKPPACAVCGLAHRMVGCA